MSTREHTYHDPDVRFVQLITDEEWVEEWEDHCLIPHMLLKKTLLGLDRHGDVWAYDRAKKTWSPLSMKRAGA